VQLPGARAKLGRRAWPDAGCHRGARRHRGDRRKSEGARSAAPGSDTCERIAASPTATIAGPYRASQRCFDHAGAGTAATAAITAIGSRIGGDHGRSRSQQAQRATRWPDLHRTTTLTAVTTLRPALLLRQGAQADSQRRIPKSGAWAGSDQLRACGAACAPACANTGCCRATSCPRYP
jgi:hypothetical protein